MRPAYIADSSSIWEALGLIPFRDSNLYLERNEHFMFIIKIVVFIAMSLE